MRFEEVLPALRTGKKIRRKDIVWQNYYGFLFISKTENKIYSNNIVYCDYRLTKKDLNANDWEIVKEIKKVKLRDLTKEQLEKWRRTNCIDDKCHDCIFNKVDCIYVAYCLIKDKSLFSDKFLDKEIEVEE